MNTRNAMPRIAIMLVISLTCLAANAAGPTNISGLALWLKADTGIRTNATGSITNWVDQSPAGIVLTNLWPQSSASGPLLTNNWANGKPAVRFQKAAISGPETNVLVVPSGSLSITQNQARTLFMVVRLTHVPPGVNNELFGTHTGTQIAIGDSVTPTQIRMRNGTPTFYSNTGTVGLGTNYIIAIVGHPDTGIEVYRNGTAFGTTNSLAPWSYALTNAVGVGTPMSNFDRNFHGHLAELVLYGRALDAGEQFQVGSYLAERYDITTTYVASLAVTNLPGLVARRDTTAILGGRVTEGLAPDLWFLWSTNANLGATTDGWGGTSIVANASIGADYQITASNLLPNTTYYWRCFASNATSTAWAATTNSFTTHGNPLAYTPPPVTAGLVFHVDASVLPYADNAYFEWLPISAGTPSEFLQNYATTSNWPRFAASVAALGNRPAMRFNKSQGFVGSLPAIGANKDRTIFLVLVSTENNTSHSEVLGSDTGTKIDVGGMVSNNTVGVRNTYWVFSEPASFTANLPYILAVTDGAAEVPRTAITINGDESTPYAYSNPSFQETYRFASWGLDTTFRIGRSAHEIIDDNRSFAGDLAEVLIYDRVLSGNQHQTVGRHLAAKYGIPTTYRSGTVIMIQ